MIPEINKLKILYRQLDSQQGAGEDVVADLRKEINNLELAYIKDYILPQVAQFMASKIRGLRCSIDSSLQYDGVQNINYSFCTSGSMLLVKDSFDINNSSVNLETISTIVEPQVITQLSNEKNSILLKGTSNISIVDYSEKAVAVYGDTKKISEELKSLGGYFNPRLRGGIGWIFSKKRLPDLKELIDSYIQEPKSIAEPSSERPLFSNSANEEADHLTEDQWIKMILSMKGTQVKGLTSPHKAIFILSIIDLIQRGFIRQNRIFPSSLLADTFTCKWNDLIPTHWPFRANVFQPYIHMNGEPFYFLVNFDGVSSFNINQSWTRSQVMRYVKFAYFNKQLFELLHQHSFTDKLSKYLIDKYVHNQNIYTPVNVNKEYADSLSNETIAIPTAKTEEPSKRHTMNILSIDTEYIHIKHGNLNDMFRNFLNEIGPKVVFDMKIDYMGNYLIDTKKNPFFSKNCIQLNGGYWVNISPLPKTVANQIKRICEILDIDVTITMQQKETLYAYKPESRPRVKYSFNGGLPLNKRQIVLEVIKYYMKVNPTATFKQLESAFPKQLQGGYGVITPIYTINRRIQNGYDDARRYYLDKDKILQSSDGVDFAVCHQWGHQFTHFQKYIHDTFNWTIKQI